MKTLMTLCHVSAWTIIAFLTIRIGGNVIHGSPAPSVNWLRAVCILMQSAYVFAALVARSEGVPKRACVELALCQSFIWVGILAVTIL